MRIRLGDILNKLMNRPLPYLTFIAEIRNVALSVISNVEKKKPFYTVLFPDVDLPGLVTSDLEKAIEEKFQQSSRANQGRKLLSVAFEIKAEACALKFFSYDCDDNMLIAYIATLTEHGDSFFMPLAKLHIDRKISQQKLCETSRAHFKVKYFYEILKFEILTLTIGEVSGVFPKEDDIRRFEYMINEHMKKLGVEAFLLFATSQEGISELAGKYNFSETKVRKDIIEMFINGIANNQETLIDEACYNFPKALMANYSLVKGLTERP